MDSASSSPARASSASRWLDWSEASQSRARSMASAQCRTSAGAKGRASSGSSSRKAALSRRRTSVTSAAGSRSDSAEVTAWRVEMRSPVASEGRIAWRSRASVNGSVVIWGGHPPSPAAAGAVSGDAPCSGVGNGPVRPRSCATRHRRGGTLVAESGHAHPGRVRRPVGRRRPLRPVRARLHRDGLRDRPRLRGRSLRDAAGERRLRPQRRLRARELLLGVLPHLHSAGAGGSALHRLLPVRGRRDVRQRGVHRPRLRRARALSGSPAVSGDVERRCG